MAAPSSSIGLAEEVSARIVSIIAAHAPPLRPVLCPAGGAHVRAADPVRLRRGHHRPDAGNPPRNRPFLRAPVAALHRRADRSEAHTSELPSLLRISYAVFRLNK